MIQKIAVSLRLKIGIGEIVMANNACRKLPVGIQSFNKIREEGYLSIYIRVTSSGNWRTMANSIIT